MARETIREPVRHIVIAPRVVISAIAIILLASAGVGVYWQWRFGLPPETDDLRAIHAASAAITDDLPFDSPDNAVHRYRTIFVDVLGFPGANRPLCPTVNDNELHRLWRQTQEDQSLANLRAGTWGDPRHAPGLAAMRALRPILDGLDHAAELERFRPRYSSSGDIFHPVDDDGPLSAIEVHSSHLTSFRAVGSLNAVQMRVSAHAGDWDDVEQRVRAGLRLGSHLGDEPFLFSLVIGSLIETMTLEELRLILSETLPPIPTIDSLIALVEQIEKPSLLAPRLDIEKRRLVGEVRWAFSSDVYDVFTVYFWETRFESDSPRRIIRDGNQYIDDVARYLAMPRPERDRVGAPSAGAAADYVWPIDRTFASLDGHTTLRAGTLAILRVLRYEREHGRLPKTLEEAMTAEQALDPVTGKPFVYLVGRDGMRVGDASIDEATGVRTNSFGPRVVDAVGPRWEFTLHAPFESSAYMSTIEFTQRRGEIYEPPPNATP